MKTIYNPERFRNHYENFKRFSPEVVEHFRKDPKVCIIPSDKMTRYSRSSNAKQLFERYINDPTKRIDKLDPHYALIADSEDAPAKPMIILADSDNDRLRSAARNTEISFVSMGKFKLGFLRYDMPFSLFHDLFGISLITMDAFYQTTNKKCHNEIVLSETAGTIQFLQRLNDLTPLHGKSLKNDHIIRFSLVDGGLCQWNIRDGQLGAFADYHIGYSNADLMLFESIRMRSTLNQVDNIPSMAFSARYFGQVLSNHIKNTSYYDIAAKSAGNTIRDINTDGSLVELKVLSKDPSRIKSALSRLWTILDSYYWPFRGITSSALDLLTCYSVPNFFFGREPDDESL